MRSYMDELARRYLPNFKSVNELMLSNNGTTQRAERCHDLAFYYYDVYHNDDAIYTMADKKVVEKSHKSDDCPAYC